MWVWACVCESVHCERVRNSCRRTRQRERERDRERERERERDSLSHTHSLPLSLTHTHSHTHQKDLSPIPHGHTLRCPRSIPSSSCASIASFSCTTTSLLRCTSRHTWPSLLSLSAHRVTSDGLSPLQPHVPVPPVPPRPPRDQQGNLVLQPGDCCLLILQRLCIKWWGGGFVCVCQCVCVRALSLE